LLGCSGHQSLFQVDIILKFVSHPLDLNFKDVIVHENEVRVTIQTSKTRKFPFRFILLKNEDALLDPVGLVNSYLALCKNPAGRFFRNYNIKSGHYIQNMGVGALQEIPQNAAKLLELPNFAEYTFHCFRRSGATALADEGANLLELKRAGRWASSKVAEGL
jgi:integrase